MFLLFSFDSSLLLHTLKNMLAWGEDGIRKHHHFWEEVLPMRTLLFIEELEVHNGIQLTCCNNLDLKKEFLGVYVHLSGENFIFQVSQHLYIRRINTS